jgi:hypothetical protein
MLTVVDPLTYNFQFRFADKVDIMMMVIGTICSLAHGAGMPLATFVFGDMTQKLVNHSYLEPIQPTYVLIFFTQTRYLSLVPLF